MKETKIPIELSWRVLRLYRAIHTEVDQVALKSWEKRLRADARADNYTLFRNHLRKLGLPEKPHLMLRGTIQVVRAIISYATMDNQPWEQFLDMQRYNRSEAPDARYVFTFDLNGKAQARVLADSKLVLPDLADLYIHLFSYFKTLGYNSVCISRPDWASFTKKELEELETEVTDDLRYDYSEDELDFWFDARDDDTYLFVSVYDHEDEEE